MTKFISKITAIVPIIGGAEIHCFNQVFNVIETPNDIINLINDTENLTGTVFVTGSHWLPIESAPNDGTLVLVMSPAIPFPFTAKFTPFGWMDAEGWILKSETSKPTHWIPLPKEPPNTIDPSMVHDDIYGFLPGTLSDSITHTPPTVIYVNGNQWLPIDSAPKDGSPVLVYIPSYSRSTWASYDNGVWTEDDDNLHDVLPTHWFQLPETPHITDQTQQPTHHNIGVCVNARV